jgi:hypothetical protein
MAIARQGVLLKNIQGALGKNIVIKQYGDKTVITAFPDMPKRKATPLKKIYEDRFREAHKYARKILSDRNLKKAYEKKVKPGQRVYNYAVSEYLLMAKSGKLPSEITLLTEP